MWSTKFQDMWEDLVVAVSLLTRIPVSKYRNAKTLPNLTKAQWAFPLVGAFVGLITIFVASSFHTIGLNDTASAVIGIMVSILIVGSFYEYGLSKCLGERWEGLEKKQRIEKTKYSSLDTSNVLWLIILTLLKVSLIEDLLNISGCFLFVMGSFALGRTSMVVVRRISLVSSNAEASILVGKASLSHTLLAILLGGIWIAPMGILLCITAICVMLISSFSIRLVAINQTGGISVGVLAISAQFVEVSTLLIINLWF